MKNNKGFISMTLVYTFLVLFLFLILAIITAYSKKNSYLTTIDDRIKTEVKLNGSELNSSSVNLWFNECNGSSSLACMTIANGAFLSTIQSDYVSSSSGIDYGNISSDTNGKGLYYSTANNNTERIYFYRGNVTDNNVVFAGMCWKIVTIDNNQSVKLVYNGAYSSSCSSNLNVSLTSKFNSADNDNAYLGYKYGNTGDTNYYNTHANTNNSLMKTALENWYFSNLNSYSSKIINAVFCNDRSILDLSSCGYGTTTTYYGAKSRLAPGNFIYSASSPSLSCKMLNGNYYGSLNKTYNNSFTTLSTNGNGDLTYSIGLLTADEVALAGGVYGLANTSFYLHSDNTYWTMSPMGYSSGAKMFVVSNGSLTYQSVSTSSHYMPVIVINGGLTISSSAQTGSYSNPYMVN